MSNRRITVRKARRALPGVVLVVMTAAFLMASTAGAVDPPIVTVGSIGTTVSGTVDADGADACVGDQHSGVDTSTNAPVKVNDASCTSNGGASTGGSSTGGTQGTTGSQPTSSSAKGSTASSSAASVSSGQAVGLRIVRVRQQVAGVRMTKRFGLIVSIRDARGKRVRGAIVSVRRMPGARNTVTGIQATFSNKLGQARLVVPVTRKQFGKRIFLKVAARTPSARAIALRSVVLPRLR